MFDNVIPKVKAVSRLLGLRPSEIYQKLLFVSLGWALRQQEYLATIRKLHQIVADISQQESRVTPEYNIFWEKKRRGLHSFQCELMLQATAGINADKIAVADIGDSAGTHMLYLQALLAGKVDLSTVSVNLDQRAVEKIRKKGLKAVLKRAEDIGPEDIGSHVDLFTSFEMVEHLHNPAIFFHRLAKKSSCNRILITVPYVRRSRVGLYSIRQRMSKKIYAEDEHIFELSPEDWTLLFLHAGWEVVFSKVYYQYPRKIPILTNIFQIMWRRYDFEGFWGVILKKNTFYSDRYLDWEG